MDAMGDGDGAAGGVRNPRPPRRPAHGAGDRQRLEKRHLPLGHELRLRSTLVILRSEEIGVEDDCVGCGSVGGGVHGVTLLGGKGTGLGMRKLPSRKMRRSDRSVIANMVRRWR